MTLVQHPSFYEITQLMLRRKTFLMSIGISMVLWISENECRFYILF